MGEVFYSSMKFKKNLRRGTAATQDEDVTYSEVKINNPTTSNTVCHCGSAGHNGLSSHPYRRAAVCLGLLCALLLAATLVLCVLYTRLSGNYSMLERELEELRSRYNTTNKEKDQQQKSCSMLKKNLEELRSNCSTMNEEKVQQQEKNSMLEKELEELRSSYNTMNEEKVQQQSRVCEPCPQGWEQFSSKCYYFSNEKKNWENSRSDCIKRGAHLVIIESDEERRFINKQTKNWIGLSRFKRNWLWLDGTPLQKGFWGSGEPADQSGLDCAMVTPEINGWNTYYCSNREQWICETNALLP